MGRKPHLFILKQIMGVVKGGKKMKIIAYVVLFVMIFPVVRVVIRKLLK